MLLAARRACACLVGFASVALATLAPPAHAHDPDTTGGLFRSVDDGANWSPINPGIYASGALALAADPRDASHLLLATDSGAWRSRNGGRDWQLEAQDTLRGPAFGVVFDADGTRALIASGAQLMRNDGDGWKPLRAPTGALPARALVDGGAPGRVYLVGLRGVYRSDDFGRAWTDIGRGFGAVPVASLARAPARADDLIVVTGGALHASDDGGQRWRRLGAPANVDAAAFDRGAPARRWVIGAAQLQRSDDGGATWQRVGAPLPDALARAGALRVDGATVLVATDRGFYRSTDNGAHWDAPKESVPAHLPATLLVRDGTGPVYAGFALVGFDTLRERVPPQAVPWFETWQRPAAFAAIVLVALGGAALVLRRRREDDAADTTLAAGAGAPVVGSR